MVATYGGLIKNSDSKTAFFLNSGLTAESAKDLIESGKIDVAVFGMAWIANPDLADRIRKGLPLVPMPKFHQFYSWEGEDLGVGYSDYPDAEAN